MLPKYFKRQESGMPSLKVEADRSARVIKPVVVVLAKEAKPLGEAEAWSK